MLGLLGQGSFGKVMLAIDIKTNENYAIKIMRKSRLKD